jgi:hypothetical protein
MEQEDIGDTLLKPKKERSQAQIDAFEKAKEKRMEYAKIRQAGIKEVKEAYKKKPYVKKADRVANEEEEVKVLPQEIKKPKEIIPEPPKAEPKLKPLIRKSIAKPVEEVEEVEEESEEEPVKIIKKPKKVKKQPRVIFQNETESEDSENEIIIIKRKNKNKTKTKEAKEEIVTSTPTPAVIIPPVPQRKLFFI